MKAEHTCRTTSFIGNAITDNVKSCNSGNPPSFLVAQCCSSNTVFHCPSAHVFFTSRNFHLLQVSIYPLKEQCKGVMNFEDAFVFESASWHIHFSCRSCMQYRVQKRRSIPLLDVVSLRPCNVPGSLRNILAENVSFYDI